MVIINHNIKTSSLVVKVNALVTDEWKIKYKMIAEDGREQIHHYVLVISLTINIKIGRSVQELSVLLILLLYYENSSSNVVRGNILINA